MTGNNAFSCPSYSHQVKLEFGKVHEAFVYQERCPSITGEDALLGTHGYKSDARYEYARYEYGI